MAPAAIRDVIAVSLATEPLPTGDSRPSIQLTAVSTDPFTQAVTAVNSVFPADAV